MTVRPVVGVLGGMGPEATVMLMRRVIEMTPARDDADHVPMIVDCNTQAPSRIAALVDGHGPSPGPTLAAMAQRLERWGAAALAMPCNTGHAYLDEIREAVAIPVLDMVDLAARACREAAPRGGRVGLLASTALRITRLYEAPLANRGLRIVYPRDQEPLMSAIRAVKRDARDPVARRLLAESAAALRDGGADMMLVACTEFSLISDALPPDAPQVDALDALAGAIVALSPPPP